MNDHEAEQQVQQMISFIMNEARTTANESQQKTFEDFNVEKLKLVQNMKDSIRTEMDAKKKKHITSKAIEKSTAINRARLSKIQARHECIEIMGKECEKKLGDVARQQDKYRAILVDLMVQGCLKLMEPVVTVRCRAADTALVKSVMDAASSKYTQVIQKATGASISLKLTIDSQNLPATSLGGVILCCQDGAIIVDNSLETRLKLSLEAEKPAIRKMLFPGK